MPGVHRQGWKAIPAVRSGYGADTLLDRYRSVGRCSQYFPVNTRAGNPGSAIPRSIGRDGAGASTMQSHFVQAFFTRSARITFRALLTSSSCSALNKPTETRGG